MKEFKVNEYITLKMEGGKTLIYIEGKRFLQCFRLFLHIPQDKISYYDQIDSIDEATEVFDKYLYENKIVEGIEIIRVINEMPSITPEQEFWGHCSNLQAWVDNNYDTRLLHSNLAFPLLKKLTEIGDPIAKRVFKEEVVKRYTSGYEPVKLYLKKEGFLDDFSKEELEVLGGKDLANEIMSLRSSRHYEYSLWVHWKQGDDLARYLKRNNNDAKISLITWAQSFRESAKRIRQLVSMFEGKDLTVPIADTHGITLAGDIETLDKAVEENLINKHKIEDF